MKKIILFLLVLSLIFAFAACGQKEENATPVVGEIEQNEETTSYEVKIEKLEETIKDEEGNKMAVVIREYPVIIDEKNSPQISKINEEYKNEAQRIYNEKVAEFKELIPEIKEMKSWVSQDTEFFYESSNSVSVKYNKDGIISIIENTYSNIGGAHPNIGLITNTYDLTTGKKIELTDIFSISREELNQIVLEGFKFKEAEGMLFFEGALEQNIGNVSFYLEEDKVVFYFNTDEVGPYAIGIPSTEIFFSEDPEIFNPKFIK